MPTSKNSFLSIHIKKFLTPFLCVYPDFYLHSFISKLLSGRKPPNPGRPGPFLTIYPYFYIFTYTFFQKTPSLDAPLAGCRVSSPPPSQATAHNQSSGRLRENCVCFCN